MLYVIDGLLLLFALGVKIIRPTQQGLIERLVSTRVLHNLVFTG